jgi:hypothetical protein
MWKKNGFARLKAAGLFTAAAIAAIGATAGSAEAAPYQKMMNTPCSGVSSSCLVVMEAAVPANKRVQVANVACRVSIVQNAQIQYLALVKTPGTVVEHLAPTRVNAGAPGPAYYVYNGMTVFLANPGEQLYVSIWATGDLLNLQCKIAGTIVDLP